MIRPTAPIRFLCAAMLFWAGLRILLVSPSAMEAVAEAPKLIAGTVAPRLAGIVEGGPATHSAAVQQLLRRPAPVRAAAFALLGPDPLGASDAAPGRRTSRYDDVRHAQMLLAAFAPSATHPMLMRFPRRSPLPATAAAPPAPRASVTVPWRLSAWTLWRTGSGPPPLANGGQLGGSQAGLRTLYDLGRVAGTDLALSARMSRPLESDGGTEAALGISARPLPAVPVEFTIERRIAVERGGRDAWAMGLAGGVYREPLPLGLELDGYFQAGVVGARSRDLYGDLAVAVARPVRLSERTTLSLGGAAWASAQPGTSRVDVGPQAVLRFPVGEGALALALGWRQRIAGDAAPGSGPALTLGTDF